MTFLHVAFRLIAVVSRKAAKAVRRGENQKEKESKIRHERHNAPKCRRQEITPYANSLGVLVAAVVVALPMTRTSRQSRLAVGESCRVRTGEMKTGDTDRTV